MKHFFPEYLEFYLEENPIDFEHIVYFRNSVCARNKNNNTHTKAYKK